MGGFLGLVLWAYNTPSTVWRLLTVLGFAASWLTVERMSPSVEVHAAHLCLALFDPAAPPAAIFVQDNYQQTQRCWTVRGDGSRMGTVSFHAVIRMWLTVPNPAAAGWQVAGPDVWLHPAPLASSVASEAILSPQACSRLISA
jgi:hypothetical protein